MMTGTRTPLYILEDSLVKKSISSASHINVNCFIHI